MSITSEKQLPEAVAAWRDPEMDSVKGTDVPKDPNKGYIAFFFYREALCIRNVRCCFLNLNRLLLFFLFTTRQRYQKQCQ